MLKALYLNDSQLYSLLKSGLEKDRRLFYQHFSRRVSRIAYRIVNNLPDAEEITQDVFIEVFSKYHSFKKEASLSTILYRITTNKALDKLKYYKRKKRISSFVSLFRNEDPLPLPDTHYQSNPEQQMEEDELHNILYNALEKITEKQRIAYTLCDMDDLSYKEIAEIMELSISAVESHIFKARKKLREILSEYYTKNKIAKQVSPDPIV
jgi:RNA polymerase sigma-70 factor (family 1)